MKKSELKKIMEHNCMLECEIEDAINFVCDLLYFRRKKLEDDESYATRTIDDLLKAEYAVYDLIEYVNELEEE